MRKNLDEGNLKFVVLMDRLEDRLKDLITYINQNSEFDIYAVEVEFYKHEDQEIVIPKIYGTEVKKDLKIRAPAKRWTWDLLASRLQEVGEAEVAAATHIIDWTNKNDVKIDWSTSQRGGFILCFYTAGNKGFYPFGITGDGKIEWNAPHAANKSPEPFDKKEHRAEILRRLQAIDGATVDLSNVDGYKGLRLPLRALADKKARDIFFSVCSWIKATLKNGAP